MEGKLILQEIEVNFETMQVLQDKELIWYDEINYKRTEFQFLLR